MKIDSDIFYRQDTDYDPKFNSLDIYFTPTKPDGPVLTRPVVVFIHGGNWSTGDKAFPSKSKTGSMSLPHWFVDLDYVFVSINFRLGEDYKTNKTTVPDMLADIAKALKWLTVNVRRYGGKDHDFILLGYSSGAHLANLIATDLSYLESFRMDSSVIRAVISWDAVHFDIPVVIDKLQRNNSGLTYPIKRVNSLKQLIGKAPSIQKRLSPAHHIGPWLRDTSFLLLSAGLYYGHNQSFTLDMNEYFKELLLSHGVEVTQHHFANKNHSSFVDMFDEEIQEELIKFLRMISTHG